MAVALRCPDCRAKLRLADEPEPGTDIECPKCGSTFLAPDPDADEEKPRKKSKPDPEDDDGSEKKAKKPRAAAKPDSKAPRKRKAKKRETSKAALIGVITAAVLMVALVVGVLVWFFGRTPQAVEMLRYAPADSQKASGMNLGHVQKYPEFYKSIKSIIDGADFKPAADAVSQAAGTDMEGLISYAVKAESTSNGWSIIFRTKIEFEEESLAKIPGAAKQSMDGKTYYLAPGLTTTGGRARVFSPTKRLIVVCPDAMNEQAFRTILKGNADNLDATLGIRMGELGKRVTRGTFWTMVLFDNAITPPAAPSEKSGSQDDSAAQLAKTAAETLGGAQGFGYKASLGSREVRYEIDIWYKDSDKSSSVAQKWKDSPLGKADEGEPPRWFKQETQSWGDKKIAAQLLSNLGFGYSGSVFYAKSAVETNDLKSGASTAIGKVTGGAPRQGGGMTGPPGGMPGGMPRPPGGGMPRPPGGGVPGPRPPGMRRRKGRA